MDVAREGLHMIIYYHCTRDSALLLSFLLTSHPYITSDFYTCSTSFFRANAIGSNCPGISCFHIRGAWKLLGFCASPRIFVPSLHRASTDALILEHRFGPISFILYFVHVCTHKSARSFRC